MSTKRPQDSTQKLRDQIDALKEKLKKQEAAQADRQRKLDTRRKIIMGAFAIEHLSDERNRESAFTKTLLPLLSDYVTRQQDRDLLNDYFRDVKIPELPPLPAPSAANEDGPRLKSEFAK